MQSTLILKSEASNILSACVALAAAGGQYTPEAKALAEAFALALGVELAPVSDWHVYAPGREGVQLLSNRAKTRTLLP